MNHYQMTNHCGALTSELLLIPCTDKMTSQAMLDFSVISREAK